MRRYAFIFFAIALLAAGPARAADQRVIKVLPHLLDLDGRHALSPSLFDRDAYQALLRAQPDKQSGIRYDVQWRSETPGEFVLRLELLGQIEEGRPIRKTLETTVTSEHRRAQWSAVSFTGAEFKKFGPIVAWRVSLWYGTERLAKQQSFLWD